MPDLDGWRRRADRQLVHRVGRRPARRRRLPRRRTRRPVPSWSPAYGEAGPAEVAQAAALAAAAFPGYRRTTAEQRAAFLDTHRGQHRGPRRGPDRPGHGRDRPARRPGRRRDRPYGRSAPAVRHGRPRRRLARGPRGHAAARPQSAPPLGSAPAVRPGGTGGRVRGQQLPARVLGGRWRHRLRVGRRLPGGRQGSPGTPGDVRARRARHPGGRGRARSAGGHLLAAARHHARAGHGPGRATRTSRRSASPALAAADWPWSRPRSGDPSPSPSTPRCPRSTRSSCCPASWGRGRRRPRPRTSPR